MRKLKTVLFSILSVAIIAVFGFEVFAAVYINISIGGKVDYYASEIGAKVWGTYSFNSENVTGDATYLSFSGAGGTVSNDIYEISGEETDYSNITANIGTTHFSNVSDTLTFHVFIKNVGDRYIIPTLTVSVSDTSHIANSTSSMFFDLSAGNPDPLTLKTNASSATAFISSVESKISAGNVNVFGSNSSIDNEDVWCGKVTISLQNVGGNGSIAVDSTFAVRVGFMADVQYTSNDILTVYQTQNQTGSTWTKFGYNSTLSANATKVETNSLSNLYTYLDDADAFGNAKIQYGQDDYMNAIVYKDIDQVNVDINTGEIIGKLSDVNYEFEWYGREITLPAGTTLASGRTLSTDETFTVDVYAYYPNVYVRRWVVGDKQWLSISDKEFTGSVLVKEHYTATFEAVLFNPDGTIATNSYGVITRSYVNDYVPLVTGGASYLQTNYGYKTVDQNGNSATATSSTTQAQMLAWSNNLTKEWKASSLADEYKTVLGCQGENWTVYVYNILYLVKYADNNSQLRVGNGNVFTYSLYNASGVKVKTANGNVITTGRNDSNSRYESEKGGGTIGVYNSSSKGTATYLETDGIYKMSSSGFNEAGMNYGYNSTYTFGNHKQGLYSNQFLTYSNGIKRYLCDGYVGSDGYTSVFCLGLCNPWGNIWTWVFGNAVISNGTNIYAYVNFDDYNAETSNYYTATNGSGYEFNHNLLTELGYIQMSYNLPTSDNFYRYLGTSMATSENVLQSLVGLPDAKSSTAEQTIGLCDSYHCHNNTASTFGVLRGNSSAYSGASAGAFSFRVTHPLNAIYSDIGFRPSLIS